MSINERFELIIKILFAGNKRAFAKAVGISPTVVENVVGARKGKPSYEVLVKVCSNANISAEWLLFGKETDLAKNVFNIRKDLTLTVPDDPENEIKGGMTTVFSTGRESLTESNTDNSTSALISHLDNMLKEKDKEIGLLHEEIGALKAQIKQLEAEGARKNNPSFAPSMNPETVET